MAPRLDRLGFRAGVWQGRLRGLTGRGPDGAPPQVEATAAGGPVPNVRVTDDGAGGWIVSVPVPPEALGDGIAAFVLTEAASGERLGEFVLAVGEPAEDDLRAELGLLRAELDVVKRAMRRLAAKG